MSKPSIMSQSGSIAELLLDQTISMIAERGLEKISLRVIASGAHCSTAIIFQHFQSKAGLIAKSLDRAFERDEAYHQALATGSKGIVGGHLTLSDFMAFYVEARSRQDLSRFWSEITFKTKQIPAVGPSLERWHRMRTGFWLEMLRDFSFAKKLSPIISAYIVLEEVYAYSLIDLAQYRLLLHETTRSITASAFGLDNSSIGQKSVSETLDVVPLHSAIGFSDNNPMREQLLEHAVNSIVGQGIGAINQRKIAQKAAVSPSMIAYHFNDMETLLNEAIWHALVRGIPHELDPDREDAAMPTTMQEWFATLDRYVRPSSGSNPAGFYTAFARTTGQACLLAKWQPTLLPLLQYLRSLEGWGTLRVSQQINPEGEWINRESAAAFGLWIKAEAALREGGLVDPERDADDIADAAKIIFPQQPTDSYTSS